MELVAKGLGKRYGFEWIFENFDYTFQTKGKYAITGPNGSGKSTLLQVLGGSLQASKGTLKHNVNDKTLEAVELFQFVSIVAPYLELIEEFTLKELLIFHFKFKKYLPNVNQARFLEIVFLEKHANKQIRYYSSGMKQRVKLGLALLSDTQLVLLDEPVTNLDMEGINWYRGLVEEFATNRTLLIASNRTEEYDFCQEALHLSQWKAVES